MNDWTYNDRPEDKMWSWILRGEDDAADFAAAYERALEVRRAQQRELGDVRSNLTQAFDELNQLGVLARENFTCCGTCAAAEIHDERDDSRHWHGYLWYHQQDTESLVSSPDGSVYLGYGAYPPEDFDEAAYAALPEEQRQAGYQSDVERMLDELVFPVLRKYGMRVEWNRSQATRVLVTGARWYAPLA